MAASDFFDQQASIQVEAPAKDRLGGADRTASWPTVIDGIPCLVRPLSVALQTRDDSRRNVTIYRIYFDSDPSPTGLGTRNRIKVGSRTYQVTGVVDVNSMGQLFQVDCEAIANA